MQAEKGTLWFKASFKGMVAKFLSHSGYSITYVDSSLFR